MLFLARFPLFQNNLLDGRKIEEGKMTLHLSPLDLDQAMSSVHTMLLPTVKAGVELLCVCETEGRQFVIGDVHRIQQIITNVVSNAIKYTPSGSVTMTMGWDGNQVRFECADTGPGIPVEQQDMLFQKYVKRGGAPGTGLGLSIAKHIVELMHGSIRFESDQTVAPGTKCVVILPLTECEKATQAKDQSWMKYREQQQEADLAEEDPIKEPITILIVDDIRMNRTMLKRRIKKAIAPQSTVSEACTGEEALEICQHESFDVVIVDQYMEEAGGIMRGTDTIIAMKRMGLSSLLIGCSGNDMDDEFRSAGTRYVWKKPLPSNSEIIRQLRDGKTALVSIYDDDNAPAPPRGEEAA